MTNLNAQQKRARKPKSQRDQSSQRKRIAIRKRAVLACEECRGRKRKCDGKVPACGGCTKRRSACVYSAQSEENEWHQTMIQSLRQQLEALESASAEMPHPTLAEHDDQSIQYQDCGYSAPATSTEPSVEVENHATASQSTVSIGVLPETGSLHPLPTTDAPTSSTDGAILNYHETTPSIPTEGNLDDMDIGSTFSLVFSPWDFAGPMSHLGSFPPGGQ